MLIIVRRPLAALIDTVQRNLRATAISFLAGGAALLSRLNEIRCRKSDTFSAERGKLDFRFSGEKWGKICVPVARRFRSESTQRLGLNGPGKAGRDERRVNYTPGYYARY